jgi:L-ascorbate oxidase
VAPFFLPSSSTDKNSFNVTASEEYTEISHNGPVGTSNYLLNGQNAKPDLSAGTHSLWEVEAGKKYLFRFVNSAAQSGWRVAVDGHSMTVIGMGSPF